MDEVRQEFRGDVKMAACCFLSLLTLRASQSITVTAFILSFNILHKKPHRFDSGSDVLKQYFF